MEKDFMDQVRDQELSTQRRDEAIVQGVLGTFDKRILTFLEHDALKRRIGDVDINFEGCMTSFCKKASKLRICIAEYDLFNLRKIRNSRKCLVNSVIKAITPTYRIRPQKDCEIQALEFGFTSDTSKQRSPKFYLPQLLRILPFLNGVCEFSYIILSSSHLKRIFCCIKSVKTLYFSKCNLYFTNFTLHQTGFSFSSIRFFGCAERNKWVEEPQKLNNFWRFLEESGISQNPVTVEFGQNEPIMKEALEDIDIGKMKIFGRDKDSGNRFMIQK
ncbi:unnamed protein product [Moneuplotes crassus]|uniref:Uncharacterized protein n=1 Tax=Euplotes crassus TaxID=5936 RepID=A0AAD2CYT6_EUPCR|nr:unnamed protein product [Moneuplotes crassus]